MVKDIVSVKYKEHDVGAVSFNTETGIGSFEFEPRFLETGIELSPKSSGKESAIIPGNPLKATGSASGNEYIFRDKGQDSRTPPGLRRKQWRRLR